MIKSYQEAEGKSTATTAPGAARAAGRLPSRISSHQAVPRPHYRRQSILCVSQNAATPVTLSWSSGDRPIPNNVGMSGV